MAINARALMILVGIFGGWSAAVAATTGAGAVAGTVSGGGGVAETLLRAGPIGVLAFVVVAFLWFLTAALDRITAVERDRAEILRTHESAMEAARSEALERLSEKWLAEAKASRIAQEDSTRVVRECVELLRRMDARDTFSRKEDS